VNEEYEGKKKVQNDEKKRLSYVKYYIDNSL
jgi:hypothetical protein